MSGVANRIRHVMTCSTVHGYFDARVFGSAS